MTLRSLAKADPGESLGALSIDTPDGFVEVLEVAEALGGTSDEGALAFRGEWLRRDLVAPLDHDRWRLTLDETDWRFSAVVSSLADVEILLTLTLTGPVLSQQLVRGA